MGQADHAFWGLLEEDLANEFYGAPELTVIAALVLFVAPFQWGRLDGVSLVAMTLFALVTLLVVRRVRILRRLCRTGVEVQAHLAGVDDSSGGETDFRHANYQYEYAGNSYWLSVTGADFFVGEATRHGEHLVLLVDPLRPHVSVVLGTIEFGDPSRWRGPDRPVRKHVLPVKEVSPTTRGARRCTNPKCEYVNRWLTGTMSSSIYGQLRCRGRDCDSLYDPRDVIDPENEEYRAHMPRA